MELQTIENLIEETIEEIKKMKEYRDNKMLCPSERIIPPDCKIGGFTIVGDIVYVRVETKASENKIREDFMSVGEIKGDYTFIEYDWKKKLETKCKKGC